jgi:hypothetical protein
LQEAVIDDYLTAFGCQILAKNATGFSEAYNGNPLRERFVHGNCLLLPWFN